MSNFKWLLVLLFCINALVVTALREEEGGKDVWDLGRPFVKSEERRSIVSTENGQVTGARVSDGVDGSYLLHFITLEPNALFLPVLLHADMVFYVHTGTGSLGWNEEDEMKHANVKKGDVYRLPAGAVFFAQSSLESERQKLRIYAIFANSINDLREPVASPYTSISDLVLGFDKDVLQAAFSVPESVIEEILYGTKQPAIIHGQTQTEPRVSMWDKQMEYVRQLVRKRGMIMSVLNKKKKKDEEEKMYNIMEEDRDFENCNGWSLTVTSNNLDALKGSDIGIFMVNLTKGSMMGPHWNPMATEIAMVLKGQGIVKVVCPKTSGNVAECRDLRFHVNEGDVFVVPRFHPMAQMAFNNGSFVFMGFSTSAKNNHPQFLAGKASVFRTLNVDVVAASFNVTSTTITQLLAAQDESVILECVSCAEEELRIMQEEMEREMEERRKREEEEERKAEEERRREEEEAREREEEKARKEEEERKQKEEEEARRKEEEEGQKREEEAAAKREEEQRRQEEEARRKEEEEAQREEEGRKQREEEEARRKEEEEKKRREKEQREEQRKQEEEARKKEEARREEEERRQREEEERKRQEEEQRREEEVERKREEQRKQEEEARRKEEEAQREEERQQKKEEEVRRREEEAQKREEEREAHRQREEKAAQEEQEQARRAEEAARRAAEEARRAAKEEQERERRHHSEPEEAQAVEDHEEEGNAKPKRLDEAEEHEEW